MVRHGVGAWGWLKWFGLLTAMGMGTVRAAWRAWWLSRV